MNLLDGLVLAVHLVGASVWVGGSLLLGVVAAAIGASRDPARAALVAEVGRRLARVMWPALAIAVLTGFYNLTWFLPPGATLASQPVLAAKFVTVGVVIAAAGLHTFVLGPRLRRRRERGEAEPTLAGLRRASVASAIVATAASVLVLVFAGLLGAP